MLYTVRPHSPQSTAPQSKGNSKKDKNEFSLSLSSLRVNYTPSILYRYTRYSRNSIAVRSTERIKGVRQRVQGPNDSRLINTGIYNSIIRMYIQ